MLFLKKKGRIALPRTTMSMEQRWQDLANLLIPPSMSMAEMSSHSAAAHYSQHYGYQVRIFEPKIKFEITRKN